MKYFVKNKIRSKAVRARLKNWLDALESDEYIKIKDDYCIRLEPEAYVDEVTNKNCAFCALGVAAVVNGVHPDEIDDSSTFDFLLGLKGNAHDEITWMNDNQELSFKAIAKEIRADLASGNVEL
jgi:hypothetical protein